MENSAVKILYASEGLLGQIVVADYPLYENEKLLEGSQRILFVNRSTQTIVIHKGSKESYFEYVQLIDEKIQEGAGMNALIMGLGGGSVANVLARKGCEVQAVELDARMEECARGYFDLDPNVKVVIDDARHFLRTRQFQKTGFRKYDVMVLDAFVGEVNPHHLFTREFFLEAQSLLSDSGLFLINGNGFWSGETGKGMRSVCKTLLASGFDVELIPTGDREEYRNLLFVCNKSKLAEGSATSDQLRSIGLSDDHILTDDKPQLEILNAEANKKWREGCIRYFLSGYYSKQDLLFFQ